MNFTPNFKVKRIRSKEHLAFVASHNCCIDTCNVEAQVHHLTCSPEPKARGKKAGDNWTVPLCKYHHDDLHASGNERKWWNKKNIDPIVLAIHYYLASGKQK